eukprot:Gb_15554 [translate_table: standard]
MQRLALSANVYAYEEVAYLRFLSLALTLDMRCGPWAVSLKMSSKRYDRRESRNSHIHQVCHVEWDTADSLPFLLRADIGCHVIVSAYSTARVTGVHLHDFLCAQDPWPGYYCKPKEEKTLLFLQKPFEMGVGLPFTFEVEILDPSTSDRTGCGCFTTDLLHEIGNLHLIYLGLGFMCRATFLKEVFAAERVKFFGKSKIARVKHRSIRNIRLSEYTKSFLCRIFIHHRVSSFETRFCMVLGHVPAAKVASSEMKQMNQ